MTIVAHPSSRAREGASEVRAERPSESPPSIAAVIRRVRRDTGPGRLIRSDLAVFEELLGFRGRVVDSCWTTKKEIARRLGVSPRTIQSSFRRLEQCGHIRQVQVETPDPDEPRNRTGWRIVFLALARPGRGLGSGPDRRPPAGRSKSALGGGNSLPPPPGGPVSSKGAEVKGVEQKRSPPTPRNADDAPPPARAEGRTPENATSSQTGEEPGQITLAEAIRRIKAGEPIPAAGGPEPAPAPLPARPRASPPPTAHPDVPGSGPIGLAEVLDQIAAGEGPPPAREPTARRLERAAESRDRGLIAAAAEDLARELDDGHSLTWHQSVLALVGPGIIRLGYERASPYIRRGELAEARKVYAGYIEPYRLKARAASRPGGGP